MGRSSHKKPKKVSVLSEKFSLSIIIKECQFSGIKEKLQPKKIFFPFTFEAFEVLKVHHTVMSRLLAG